MATETAKQRIKRLQIKQAELAAFLQKEYKLNKITCYYKIKSTSKKQNKLMNDYIDIFIEEKIKQWKREIA